MSTKEQLQDMVEALTSLDIRHLGEEERDEAEILKLGTEQIAPAGVSALNPAFDVTPGALITAIVTEHGVLRPPYGPSIKSLLLNTAPARA